MKRHFFVLVLSFICSVAVSFGQSIADQAKYFNKSNSSYFKSREFSVSEKTKDLAFDNAVNAITNKVWWEPATNQAIVFNKDKTMKNQMVDEIEDGVYQVTTTSGTYTLNNNKLVYRINFETFRIELRYAPGVELSNRKKAEYQAKIDNAIRKARQTGVRSASGTIQRIDSVLVFEQNVQSNILGMTFDDTNQKLYVEAKTYIRRIKAIEQEAIEREKEAKLRAEAEEAERKAREEKKLRAAEIMKNVYDTQTDVKVKYYSDKGTIRLFNDTGFASEVTKMYVEGEEMPVSSTIIRNEEGNFEVVFKTNGIKELPKGTFKDQKYSNTGSINAMYFPASLEKMGALNGSGCSYCADIYFYGSKAPKGPSILGGYIFEDIMNAGTSMGNAKSIKKLHIMKGAKGFTGLTANPSWTQLVGYGFEIVEM